MTEPSPSQPATARRSHTEYDLTNDNASLKEIYEGGWNRSNKEQTDNSNDDICSITSRQQSMATEVGTAGTLAATDYKEPQSVCYAIDSTASNSMKSSNPNSGFHEESVAKTLDTKPDPTCNQGGNVIVQPSDLPKCVQANGWQYGDVASTLCGDHGNRVTDFTSICIEETKNINATAFTNRASPTEEVAETLRAESHGAIPMVAAFMGGQGAKARSIAYCDDGTTPTIKASPSGGNTVPDTVYPINTMVATRGGKDDMRTCFGVGEKNDPQFTLSAAHEHAVCYANGCDLYNGKLTGEIAPTLGANSCTSANHAGPSVCYAMEGNTVDRSAKQNGTGISQDISPSLNTQDRHAVAYGIDQQGGKSSAGYGENVSPTLCAVSHGTPNAVADEGEG